MQSDDQGQIRISDVKEKHQPSASASKLIMKKPSISGVKIQYGIKLVSVT